MKIFWKKKFWGVRFYRFSLFIIYFFSSSSSYYPIDVQTATVGSYLWIEMSATGHAQIVRLVSPAFPFCFFLFFGKGKAGIRILVHSISVFEFSLSLCFETWGCGVALATPSCGGHGLLSSVYSTQVIIVFTPEKTNCKLKQKKQQQQQTKLWLNYTELQLWKHIFNL